MIEENEEVQPDIIVFKCGHGTWATDSILYSLIPNEELLAHILTGKFVYRAERICNRCAGKQLAEITAGKTKDAE